MAEPTPEVIGETRNALFSMDDEYWKILAVYGDDQTIAETKWGTQATCAGELFGNDWLNRLIWG